MKALQGIEKYVVEFNKIYKDCDFEQVTCLCNSDDQELIANYDRYGLYSPTVICKKCGLIDSNPRLSNQSFEKFYSTDLYRKIYNNGDYIQEFRYKLENCNENEVFKYLKPIIFNKKYKSVLEIGCAAGHNLLGFKNLGLSVKGYDFGVDLVDLGRRDYGLNLENGTVIDAVNSEKKFDVVILNHVMEHFTDIKKNLSLIKQVLNKDGCIYIGIPNIDNYASSQIQNAHTYYFSPRTFLYYMNKYGYSVSSIDEAEKIHMQAILKVESQEEGVYLTNEYNIMIKKIRKVKRREFILRILDVLGLRKIIKIIANH
jgi:SAM-dependent methyltransferase